MSLSVPLSCSVGAHNSNWSSSGTSMTSNARNDFIPPMKQNPVRISRRTTEFVKGIEKKVFGSTATPSMKALKEVLWLVSKEGVTPIQDALLKRSSYFTRWFSDETWEDWTQYRTSLGRVVSMYCDYLTTSERLDSCVSRLDKRLLEVANKDAAAILKSLRDEEDPKPKEVSGRSRSSFPTTASADQSPFPAVFELSSLDGKNGFILQGEIVDGQGGVYVANAGDINGDGINDLAITTLGLDYRFYNTSYILFGSNKGWDSPFKFQNLNGTNGFIIYGNVGSSIRGAGDINGDGIADLVVGSRYAGFLAGSTYVIFGSKKNWNSSFELSSLNGVNGFILYGETGTYSCSGSSVSGAGDINGDGIGDLIIGAPACDPHTTIGKSYVVFGSKSRWNASFELSSLNGANGFILNGGHDQAGWIVNGLGDVNSDGIDDFFVGAAYNENYVVFGSRGPWSSAIELSSLYGVNGFILDSKDPGYPPSPYPSTIFSVSGAGDINGDGVGDLILGVPQAEDYYKNTYSYSSVVLGVAGSRQSPVNIAYFSGENGFILGGEDYGDQSGYSVSGTGDINGDGINDLIVGAPSAYVKGRLFAGKSYVIYGGKSGWDSPAGLSALNGTNGFILNGAATEDYSGYPVSGVGDINGDGIADFVIGANGACSFGVIRNCAGKSYVIFGKKAVPMPDPNDTQRNIIIGASIGGAAFIGLSVLGIYLLNKKCKKVGHEGESQRLVNN